MKFGSIDHRLTGVSVPVSALRSEESTGVGEFADLPLFGRWCAAAGLHVIQILPVNDTGSDSSPYSALSAYALHPLYLRLKAVPGVERLLPEISAFRERTEIHARFPYAEVLSFKLSIVERVFAEKGDVLRGDPAFSRWRDSNPWVIPYAAFKALKAMHGQAPWTRWADLGGGAPPAGPGPASGQPPSGAAGPSAGGRHPAGAGTPTPAEVWAAEQSRCLLHAWIQFLLEEQLSSASRGLQAMGIRLKGDIPILMNEDSADVWSSPRYFDRSFKAGAPPDMYSTDGQNWDFPVYDWDALAADGYSWWKGRLHQAQKFFHAFRIDHVLGFFRIWRIPRTERRGLLGRFSPYVAIERETLASLGFDEGRIHWLSVPHTRTSEIEARLAGDAERVIDACFDRVGGEKLHTLKPELDSELAILGLNEPPEVKEFLLSRHLDRTLIAVSESEFVPSWYFWESGPFKGLAPKEQERLRGLFASERSRSEEIWERRGRALLGMLHDSTDMLVCAEDLGDVPACVPRVLAELGILGLRIARWARDYQSPGAPFIPPDRYPRLSVATASVHDTSTLRAWWEESSAEREAYYGHLGLPGPCPETLTRDVLLAVESLLMDSQSLLCIFALQDLLDLDEGNWSADPRGDRVNVPGTVNERNWTWRMPVTCESLAARGEPAATIRSLAEARMKRKPT